LLVAEDSVPAAGDGMGAGVLSLLLGYPVAALFNTFVQDQDLVVLLLVLVGFGGCIVYGEVNVAMPNGVAFGVGLLMTGFVALNGWLVCLGMLAGAVSLAKYALAKPEMCEPEDGIVRLDGDSE